MRMCELFTTNQDIDDMPVYEVADVTVHANGITLDPISAFPAT
jgi:hypothetical protein